MNTHTENAVSRRSFLVGAGGTAAAVGLGSGLVFGQAETYQYIVIGSGAGGGPVCANLAKAGMKVLLLEAGDASQNDNYRVPAFWGASTEDSTYAWNYYVKQNSQFDPMNSKYVKGKGILYPRAGTLGGCTAHNAMITLYPDHSDWTHLAALTNDSSWSAEAMRRYYQRVEDALYLSSAAANDRRRGKDGWLKVEMTKPGLLSKDKALASLLASAARQSGMDDHTAARAAALDPEAIAELLRQDPNNWDYVTTGQTGLISIPKATSYGRRNGTRELLLTARERYRANFTIKTKALVTRILFADGTNKAIGVEYLEGESLYEADPRSQPGLRKHIASHQQRKVVRLAENGEVILAAGAFNTPQLLMLSGIGPREELERHGIRVRVPLAGVGRGLQDRYEVGVITKLNQPLDVLKGCTFGQKDDPCLSGYNDDALSNLYGSNGLLMGYKHRGVDDGRDPDLFLFGLPGYFHGYYPGWAKNALKPDHFTWVVLKGHTKNTAGRVSLRSADPTDAPEIDFRYFSDGNDASGDDLDAVVEGVRLARRINDDPRFRAEGQGEVYPGRAVKHDSDVREFVQREAFGHHASCSCKMGDRSDPFAVVDGNFKVHQVENLRVVDASVFPRIPGLFIAAPIYMIAEKASDVILQDAHKVRVTRKRQQLVVPV